MVFHSAIQLEIARQLHDDRLAKLDHRRGASAAVEARPKGRERLMHLARTLRALVRLDSSERFADHLAADRPFLIRHSRVSDEAALERLAQLDSRTRPEGSFLVAEVNGEIVAAAPLEVEADPFSDPFKPTANLRQLLALQARYERRYRDRADDVPGAVRRALEDVA